MRYFLIISAIVLFSCRKDESIKPVISQDSLDARKLNISTAQYLQIKSMLNGLGGSFTSSNPGNKNIVSDSLNF